MKHPVALIIPTYQAQSFIKGLLESVAQQTVAVPVLVIDSSSTDDTQEQARRYGAQLQVISKQAFNHGGTRQLALQWMDAEIYIYMTQDAILHRPDALEKLIKAFDNPQVGCAYGRQIPHQDAGILGAHLRFFNYPDYSEVRTLKDVARLGIRTCANSNSFAAYRKEALLAVGGFPLEVILGEDVYVAAKMLLQGWAIAYCAEAVVRHSHDYSVFQDFRRYFDIGVFHQMDHWILESFKSPGGVGARYIQSELKECWRQKHYGAIIQALLHVFAKGAGYYVGRHYCWIPKKWRQWCSMHRGYWQHIKK